MLIPLTYSREARETDVIGSNCLNGFGSCLPP
ncbi:MAG: hypothetical protein ACI9PN_002938, partial [Candidatus Azotimanducaceae bacterium]